MRSHARASSAGSNERRAAALGEIVRGAIAARAHVLGSDGSSAPSHRIGIALVACVLGLLAFAAPASATLPTHPELPTLNQTGFQRACGLAVDSDGNRYAADFTADEIKVYSSAGTPITSFTPSANEAGPCAIAVDSQGDVYVYGLNLDVVKYKPSSFPPTVSTTYAPDTSVNGTGVVVSEEARGVAVDPATGNVYVPSIGHISAYHSDGTLISETIGEEEVTEEFATYGSVAVRGSTGKIYATTRGGSPKAYVFSPDGSKVLAEADTAATKVGALTTFANLGVAVDQSNGHFYVADIGKATGHRVVDEFDSGGELVSEIPSPSALTEAEPSVVAVDNSGGENDGDVFVSAGQEPSSVLAFGPLTPPTHPELPTLNQTGFQRACGLAVDSDGNRYAADFTADEIKVYSSAGTPITSFTPSANEAGPCAIAVDSQGDVYVYGLNLDVVKYKPSSFPPTVSTTYAPDTSVNGTGVVVSEEARGVAVDPATGNVYVPSIGHISAYHSDGTLISETIGEEEVTEEFATYGSVAVRGSTGKIYATTRGGSPKAYVFSPDGSKVLAEADTAATKVGALTTFANLGVAVDQSNGHFYVADIGKATGHRVVDEFDSGGELVSEIPSPSALTEAEPSVVAVDNSGGENDGDVFVSAGQEPSSVLAFGPLTYTKFFKLEVAKLGAGTGTVTSSPTGVNCGAACNVDFEEGAEVTLTAVASAGSRFAGWQGCGTVAGNECTVTLTAARKVTAIFNAKPAIESLGVQARDIAARFEGKINPNGEGTSYQFEYLSEAAYQANGESFEGPEEALLAPVPPGQIEAGPGGVEVSAEVSGLTPLTTYRFRLVASNLAGTSESATRSVATLAAPPVFGPCANDGFRKGQPSAQLSDCRAYEQASPVDKNGGDVTGTPMNAKASVDGDRVSFISTTPIPGGEGAQNYSPPYLASRGASGWSTQGLFPPQSEGGRTRILGWSPNFSNVISRATRYVAGTALTTLLDRSTAAPEALTTIVPRSTATGFLEPTVPGTSDDGSIVFFENEGVALAEGATPNKPNLYVWDRETGTVRLAGVLNDEKAPPSGTFAGPYSWDKGFLAAGGAEAGIGHYTRDLHAIAPDGSSVYFTASQSGQLYLRLNPNKLQSQVVINGEGEEECTQPQLACTIRVSASQKENGNGENGADAAGSQPAAFMGASADGSKAFFTSTEMLTDDANTGSEQPPAQIGRAKIGATEAEEVNSEFLFKHAHGLTTSPDGKYLYWADPSQGTIGRAKLNSDGQASEENNAFIVTGETSFETHPKSEPGVITTAPSTPRYVAVAGEYVYWTNTGPLSDEGEGDKPVEGAGTIGRAKLDGSGNLVPDSVEPEFITGASNPQGIAVNSEHIYWGNMNSGGFGEGLFGPGGAISRSDLEGNVVEREFLSTGNRDVLALDLTTTQLYYVEYEPPGNDSSYVERIPLDGGESEYSGIFVKGKIGGLALQGESLYWTSASEGAVGRRPLSTFGGGNCGEDPTCQSKYVELEGAPAGLTSDGEHLYWATNGEGGSNPGNDLYRYDAASRKLVDLTPDPTDPDGAEVLGVAGISDDGFYVYFVANSVLAEGASPGTCYGSSGEHIRDERVSGECSLYLEHEGQASFIARLKAQSESSDFHDWRGSTYGRGGISLVPKLSRVSADGHTLLFTSTQKLTRYENEGTQELYLYRVGASEQIICVSCNPTGVPPSGAPSLGSSAGGTGLESGDPAPVLSRNLSTDGRRVFFETPEALVATDTNGKQDVYEWEEKGAGSCESEDQDGGCLYLVSSGKGSDPSFLADVSASGDDVFLFTRSRLVGQDEDSSQDLYDARVGGGYPAKPVPPPPCEGEACKEGAAPAPPVGSPTTPLFSGPGNPKPHHARTHKRKHRHKRHVRKHHKRHEKTNGRAHR